MRSFRMVPVPGRLLEYSLLSSGISRGLRSAVAFGGGWGICLLTGHAEIAMFIAAAALNVATPDVRGDYQARLLILLSLTAILTVSAVLGTIAGGSVLAAALTTAGIGLLAGYWRHLSADCGATFALGSALLFFIGLSRPGDFPRALRLAEMTMLGGCGGILVQLSGWFVRPRHSLRHAAAEVWIAAADLIAAIRMPGASTAGSASAWPPKERAMRTAADRASRVFAAAENRKTRRFVAHLDEAAQLAARIASRSATVNAALEPLRSSPHFAQLAPALEALWEALANVCRSAALTLMIHRREQFIALEVRLRRAGDLLRVLERHLAAIPPQSTGSGDCLELLRQLADLFPPARAELAATVDHGSGASGFIPRLPDLTGVSMRTLGAWIHPAAQLDPNLVRYTLRVTLLLVLGVTAYEYFQIPRGYWIPFTTMVVLQPDYGATRQKAGQRIAGTLAGSVVASLLLWVRMPVPLLVFFASVMAFFFAYFLRSRYWLAVFFVTVMLVLAVEVVMPVHLDFTIARLLSTVTGGVLALIGALLFWPKWERGQFVAVMAAALRANRKYLETIARHFAQAEPFSGEAVRFKREAERANNKAAESLQRLLGEPARRQKSVAAAAALAAYSQRLTRTLTVLAQHLNIREALRGPRLQRDFQNIGELMESLAHAVENGQKAVLPEHTVLGAPAGAAAHEQIVYGQLARILTEIEAMAVEV